MHHKGMHTVGSVIYAAVRTTTIGNANAKKKSRNLFKDAKGTPLDVAVHIENSK